MFDKLIESDSLGADFKSRRRYFLVSSLVVGTLFISAVVISIYAADIDLGNDNFELSTMITPVDLPPSAPEPLRPKQQAPENQPKTELPMRKVEMQAPQETPVQTPKDISTVPNTEMARPDGPYEIGPKDIDPPQSSGSSDPGMGTGTVTPPRQPDPPVVVEPKPEPRVEPAPKPATQSLGVINGRATALPKPSYPAPAIAMHIEGKVDVQVTIDENGKVISAKAASGNGLLRDAAEKAAWQARFTPTLLSNVPVKVTGVIVYNFTRN